MRFTIITQIPHVFYNNQYYSYSPYVREMNIWLKYVSKVIIVAPIQSGNPTPIDLAYQHHNIEFIHCENFDIKNVKSTIATLFKLPKIVVQIFGAMQKSNHIHLRCPGNMGLLGSVVQILFPFKNKTAKYAGNWDPKSKQPFAYRIQQKILNNTFLTRNMQVLVYGQWENSSKNSKPFFTASYQDREKTVVSPKNVKDTIRFVFLGTLVKGKNPLYAIQLIQNIQAKGYPVTLTLFGDGVLYESLAKHISEHNLNSFIFLKGNQNSETVKTALQESHFVILPSESEGWPKAIAEGMFWGCVPIAASVSCVPYMLDYGKRGILIHLDEAKDANAIITLLNNEEAYLEISEKAVLWSQQFTLDYFEQEIKLLLLS